MDRSRWTREQEDMVRLIAARTAAQEYAFSRRIGCGGERAGENAGDVFEDALRMLRS